MSTDYEGVLALILAESSITSLLDVYRQPNGTVTVQPLVVVGTIPEEQSGLPAISIRNQINAGQYGITESFIELHCYANTEPESRAVAQACYDFFRDSIGGVNGFASRFEATMGTTIPDENETNTIVELKLDHR